MHTSLGLNFLSVRVPNWSVPLIDRLPESDLADYLATMARLRELPVTVVHAGHDPSFGRARLVEIATRFIDHGGYVPQTAR